MPTGIKDSDTQELGGQEGTKSAGLKRRYWDWEWGFRLQGLETEKAGGAEEPSGGGIVQGGGSQTFSSKDLSALLKIIKAPQRELYLSMLTLLEIKPETFLRHRTYVHSFRSCRSDGVASLLTALDHSPAYS